MFSIYLIEMEKNKLVDKNKEKITFFYGHLKMTVKFISVKKKSQFFQLNFKTSAFFMQKNPIFYFSVLKTFKSYTLIRHGKNGLTEISCKMKMI